MIHDLSGAIIDVGRRTRKPPPALRRALRERDRGRCQYPGCDCRRTDAHHILYWANGGETNLAGLISFCKRHHGIVHEKDIIIAATATGFAFYAKDGTPIPGCPQLPHGPGDISATHDAAITPPRSTPRTPASASISPWPSGPPSPTPAPKPTAAKPLTQTDSPDH